MLPTLCVGEVKVDMWYMKRRGEFLGATLLSSGDTKGQKGKSQKSCKIKKLVLYRKESPPCKKRSLGTE